MARRMKLIGCFIAFAMLVTTAGSFACTGMYVGKDVSKEGTTVIARSEDQGIGSYNKMFKVKDRVKESGRYYKDSATGFKVKLPEETYKYTYVRDSTDANDGMYPASCTNEYGVAVVGTVSTEVLPAYEKVDPVIENKLREATLAGLICCQVKTAKEAVELCAKLHDKYGASEWNSMFFSDKKEAWVFENYGGHTYCAMKMPTDKVAVFGNQCMIGTVDAKDKENFIFSTGKYDLFKAIDKAGTAVKEEGKYNIAKSVSGTTRDPYSNMRTWEGHRVLAPSSEWVKGKEYSDNIFYPLFYKPDDKVSVLDIMDLYRDRYAGTKYDMMKSENAKMRPIGTTRSSDIHIIQTYKDLPKDTCQLQWLCMGNAEHSVFVPAFSGITNTNKAYRVDGTIYNKDSAYWQFKRNETLAQSDREFLSEGTKAFWKSKEVRELKDINKAIPKIKKAYKKGEDEGRTYVTELAEKVATKQLKNSDILYQALMFTATRNDGDRGTNERKVKFQKPVDIVKAAEKAGYKVKKEDNKLILKKEKDTYRIQLKSMGVHKNGEYAEDMTFPIFKYGNIIYGPADFEKTFSAIK